MANPKWRNLGIFRSLAPKYVNNMATFSTVVPKEENPLVSGHVKQSQANETYTKKANKERSRIGKKMMLLKKKSYLTISALVLASGAFYFGTMASLKQSKLLADFDLPPADLPDAFDNVSTDKV